MTDRFRLLLKILLEGGMSICES